MRILIVTQYFWPENFRINDLAHTLDLQGHHVDILTGKPNYPDGVLFEGYKSSGLDVDEWQGLNISRIPIIPRGHKSTLGLALNYISFVISGLLFAPWLLRNKQYDVIFVYAPSPIFQSIPASFLGWLKKSPVVLWVQDLWPESAQATGYVENLWALKAIEKIVSFVYRHTDLILVQSKAFREPVAKLAKTKKIVYFPNSVESFFYESPQMSLPHLPGLKAEFPILFAGNIGTGQAVQVIIEAAEILKDYVGIRFVILGKGSRLDWMREEIAARNLSNIDLAGSYPVETMPGLMRQAGALLVTLADKPIFAATIPSKIQAYLAVGRPILACLNGEGANVVQEAGAGLAIPAENASALASAILQLFNTSPEVRNNMGLNGRAYYKAHFDQQLLASQLTRELEALIVSFKGGQ